ncbi:hypothetical protein LSAT2_009772 [Lamellibrachia satsuma]|nr:hypothetical protein LSAT2_009772 [Lamellibrachia satsuma]
MSVGDGRYTWCTGRGEHGAERSARPPAASESSTKTPLLQKTFTDLVADLTQSCACDLQKASYAGLPCVYVEGHSKGVGYEPGMEISEDTFRNTWNLILIGDLHYKYDKFSFLTDPDEFVHMHRANDEEKQLLKTPVTLVDMPFVRSVFFKLGLQFDPPVKTVLNADNKGSTDLKLRLPPAKDIQFEYNLEYADCRKRSSCCDAKSVEWTCPCK